MTETKADVGAEMDQLSLEQALVDFEVANARVIDLTQRLVTTGAEVAHLRAELAEARTRHDELQQRMAAMQGSQAFRLASKIWNVRTALKS